MADGPALVHLGKIPFKRLQIEFQHRLLHVSLDHSFLEGKKIGGTDFLEFAGGKGVTQIMPVGHFGTDCQTETVLVHYRLLRLEQSLSQWCIGELRQIFLFNKAQEFIPEIAFNHQIFI